ncbi:iron(III) transport system substrate-binding protein [Ilumatobacter fluminis]|uniref:Iron(III) transport system substrate-binding protein n=1 Tax=Ilumatobacter fluminis TaxID=467091 RepID=A0A4R7HZV9_9ACTN|nr:extracellular solute-binding protein [Ilumatobacter fluminis]TDT16691.1 iron(III) transport system substrate-binding protein [Ilumatobacter fluminis]
MTPRIDRRHARRLALPILAVGGIALAGCGGDDDVLRVYSGRHYGIEAAFEQFTEETGIEVEFLTGNDAELRERIAAEGDETKADAYITVDAGNLAAAAEEGLFQPIESEVLSSAIPAELSDPDGLWYGLTVRARTIVYNPDEIAVDDLPTSYEELADPEWNDRVCMRNASNVYQQSLVASLIEHHGYDGALEIVEGWAANADIMGNDVLILEAVNDGLCEVGVTNHYYLAREYDENPDFDVELIWANQDDRGTHVNVSGGGITTHSSHPEDALVFLEWLATDGQQVLIGGNHEFPANPDVPPDEVLVERFGVDFVRDPLQASVFGALNPDAVRLMDEAGYG